MARKAIDPILRFNRKYIVDEKTGCWNWTEPLTKYGYGVLKIKGKFIKAHRFAYQYFKEPLVEGKIICHCCNNRKCVNPEHLRQDTYSSNSIDMVYQKKHWDQILSVQEVIEIKISLKNYYRGQIRDLAHFYKVDQRTISSIKNERSWSHVEI